jgi:hypothetical protein
MKEFNCQGCKKLIVNPPVDYDSGYVDTTCLRCQAAYVEATTAKRPWFAPYRGRSVRLGPICCTRERTHAEPMGRWPTGEPVDSYAGETWQICCGRLTIKVGTCIAWWATVHFRSWGGKKFFENDRLIKPFQWLFSLLERRYEYWEQNTPDVEDGYGCLADYE